MLLLIKNDNIHGNKADNDHDNENVTVELKHGMGRIAYSYEQIIMIIIATRSNIDYNRTYF